MLFLAADSREEWLQQRLVEAEAQVVAAQGAALVVEKLLSKRGDGSVLVVHNGIYDLLHLWHAFVGDAPNKVAEFKARWYQECPEVADS